MLHWVFIFLIAAAIAAIVGFSGLSPDTLHIGKFAAVVSLILAVGTYALHRRSRRD